MLFLILAVFVLTVSLTHSFQTVISRKALRRSHMASLGASTPKEEDSMDLDLEQMQNIFDAADKAADGETLEKVPVRNASGDVGTGEGGGFDKLDIGLRLQDLITVVLTLVIAKNTFDIIIDLLPK